MADIRAGSAFCISERPDLTIFIPNIRGKQNGSQEDGAILKLHRSVLGEYEYFKQRFSAQPDIEVFELPNCDMETSLITNMLEYLYTKSIVALERGLARSELTYATYHLSLFQLSLRFYLPELEKIAMEALDQEEIGVQEGAFGDMERLIVELYDNRRGRKWESLRRNIMKRQAWKLIKMPRKMLDKLDESFPGFQSELAEMWERKLEGSGASGSSWWMNWSI